MANYRAGDVIRLTRNAIGMTQEQLSEEICSVETLSRIENNKQGIGIEVYERLMAKMERNPLRSYAICSSMDMRIAEEKQALEDAVAKVDYEKAKEHLVCMKQIMPKTKYNEQYLKRFEALVAYHTKEIDENALVKQLEDAIRMTLPMYEKYLESDKVFPFTEQEIFAMMSLANAYFRIGVKEKSIDIYQMLVRSLDNKYMDNVSLVQLEIIVLANSNKVLGNMGRHEKVLEQIEKMWELAKQESYGYIFSNIIVAFVWNKIKMNDKSVQNNREFYIKKLRQAYYIAAARNDTYYMKVISDFMIKMFQLNLE